MCEMHLMKSLALKDLHKSLTFLSLSAIHTPCPPHKAGESMITWQNPQKQKADFIAQYHICVAKLLLPHNWLICG